MTERKHKKYDRLIARCKAMPPTPCAVAHPCDESSLRGAVQARQMGLLKPILVGPKARIEAVAAQFKLDISGCEVVDAPHSVGSAETAVRLAREGKAEMLMKGSLHTDELMAAVVKRETGLRTEPAHQPLLHHGRAGDRPRGHHHRRGREHLPDARGQGPHRPERHRPGSRAGAGAAQGGDPVRDGDDQSAGALDDRGRRAVQDGRAGPDHRRPARRAARAGQRHRPGGGQDQEDRPRPWPATPTSWWCPTSRPATCWPRA